jgi:nickel transport protein
MAAIVAWLGSVVGAEAHKLKAFATVEGATIDGYAYFTPGGRAQEADVTVTGPGNVQVLKTGVDTQGNFHFVAKQRVDYTITVDGGDAHIANYVIHASDLPDSLPLPQDGAILPLDVAAAATPAATDVGAAHEDSSAVVGAPPAVGAGVDQAALKAMIQESVAHEVNPLREQLDAFQEAVTWHDVLGGIGYIFGLCGVAYGFANRKRPDGRSARPVVQRG